ncbi:oligosaccharide flippase family protein [Mesohalobacter halotolerans]|uniref:Polysaccharide biosynthesis protein n=1 Tax=Mesohalobacter halotolerans TaxID=1883405 RepID=A0A4U5TTG3_9FLAO|nr:oligosaccharide flippase family protein [Mesohalobacter halotolerans]MBS3738852.1 oligosaccharide flippase family protein [Psychroflexus sp.]TKS57667.1 polysaccharide biosynthesis protein [Mesohalobacter halotolerans]
MNPFKTLFKHTFVYGLATVLPRMLSFLLVPLYTKLFSDSDYGIITLVFSYLIFFNVILSYGMETTVFRFFTKQDQKGKVVSTATLSILFSSLLFLVLSVIFSAEISTALDLNAYHYKLIVWVLFFDAICVIPFAYLRINKKSIRYAVIKIINVVINLGLNLFLLLKLPTWKNDFEFLNRIYVADFRIEYIFISFVISSGLTFLLLSPFFLKLKYQFDPKLWKSMMKYALPVLIAGLAFSINETLDKILLNYLLPENIAKSQVGVYGACYKLAMFMTLFATAYRLGIEPFFFSHSQTKNPKKAYALVTKYFVICGIFILLFVVVFIDYLKLIIQNDVFYEALDVVPILLLANLCLGIYHNLSVWYKITDRTRFGAIISSIGAFVTLAINIIFIPLYGFKASAIATLCAYCSMMLLSYTLGQKYYKIKYPLKRLAIYTLLGITFSALSFYLFREQVWIGVLFILGYLILAYTFEKQELLHYLKKT